MLADVVEERGELEQLAVGGVEAVQLGGGVEEVERQRGDLTGVRFRPVAAAGEARAPRSPRMACGSSDQSVGIVVAHRVEHDALAQRPLADGQLVEPEQLHRGGEHHRAGDDEVDAAGVEALDAQAVGRRRGQEVLVQREELGRGRW